YGTRDLVRGEPRVPRAWRPGPYAGVGNDDRRSAALHPRQVVDRVLPGRRYRRDGRALQHAGGPGQVVAHTPKGPHLDANSALSSEEGKERHGQREDLAGRRG